MAFKCEITPRSAQPVLAVRTHTAVQDLPAFLGRAFGAVAQYLGEQGLEPAGPPYAAYHNMDMENLDVEAGFPVTKALASRGEVQAGEMPAGRYASCLFTGAYSDMPPAYEALTQYVKDQGCEPTGVSYEVYMNDPASVAPNELQTLIVFPVKG